MIKLPEEFFTVATFFTLSGLVSAVWIITSVISYLFGPQNVQKYKKWIALILSVGFAMLGATLIKDKTALTWVVAFVNGLLVFLTAVGINTVVSVRTVQAETRQRQARKAREEEEETQVKFRERWL